MVPYLLRHLSLSSLHPLLAGIRLEGYPSVQASAKGDLNRVDEMPSHGFMDVIEIRLSLYIRSLPPLAHVFIVLTPKGKIDLVLTGSSTNLAN